MTPGWTITTLRDDGTMAAFPLGPEKPISCVDGWESHTWKLSIEADQIHLSTDCRLCTDGFWAFDHDDMGMGPVDVSLEFVPECDNLGGWHGLTRCDCGWQYLLTPTEATR